MGKVSSPWSLIEERLGTVVVLFGVVLSCCGVGNPCYVSWDKTVASSIAVMVEWIHVPCVLLLLSVMVFSSNGCTPIGSECLCARCVI